MTEWPRDADLRLNQAMALHQTGRGDQCSAALREALRLRPQWARAHTSLLFFLTRHWPQTDDALLQEHCAWGALHADALPRLSHADHSRDWHKVLNIGYISADFCAHAISHFAAQLFERHDRGSVQVTAYYAGTVSDEVTARFERAADRFVRVQSLSDEALAGTIHADGIDVLVDLSGHTKGNRVLALGRHPAPLQLTWLGYRFTTGMSAMDYRLTDVIADPPGAERYHRETLLRLSRTQWCYEPPEGAPDVSSLPAAQTRLVTFGAACDFNKMHSQLLRAWAAILRAVPQARLLLLGVPAASSADWIFEVMEDERIELSRLDLRRRTTFDRYLAAYSEIDIALDTFPCNGATTTCEALWMGVPVVSLAGSHGARRSGASLLASLGMEELAAASEAEYVECAAGLAADLVTLARMRSGLRARMQASPLMDGAGLAREIEALYRLAWGRWAIGE